MKYQDRSLAGNITHGQEKWRKKHVLNYNQQTVVCVATQHVIKTKTKMVYQLQLEPNDKSELTKPI